MRHALFLLAMLTPPHALAAAPLAAQPSRQPGIRLGLQQAIHSRIDREGVQMRLTAWTTVDSMLPPIIIAGIPGSGPQAAASRAAVSRSRSGR